jgi:hypothetical protein
MTSSKSVRNAILTLIILAIGIYGVMYVFQNLLSQYSISGFTDMIGSVREIGMLMIYGIGALIFILLILWISKKYDERKMPLKQ